MTLSPIRSMYVDASLLISILSRIIRFLTCGSVQSSPISIYPYTLLSIIPCKYTGDRRTRLLYIYIYIRLVFFFSHILLLSLVMSMYGLNAGQGPTELPLSCHHLSP